MEPSKQETNEKVQTGHEDIGVNEAVKLKLIDLIPKAAWLIIAVMLIFFLFPEIRNLIRNTSSFKGYGIEIELKSIEAYNQKNIKLKRDSFLIQKDQIINRVQLLQSLLRSKTYKIMWIDDNLSGNSDLYHILEQVGFKIDRQLTSSAGLAMIRNAERDTTLKQYDMIITKYRIDQINASQLADSVRYQTMSNVPVIIYTSNFDPMAHDVPKNVFAETDRPDFLINYTLDIVERGGTPFAR